MDSEKFRNWLELETLEKKTIQNRISNCRNVEKYEGDLDNHFIKDKGLSLLTKLSYSTKNRLNNDQPKHNVPIKGDLRTGSSTLKQSVKLYLRYKSYAELNHIELIEQNEATLSNSNLTEIEKTVLTKFRVGQSFFRNELIKYWKGCCSISGFNKTELLIASHIKPYNECDKNEKYDVYNGLLLTPNYDKLFDRFLISFDETGEILISNQLSESDLELLHISKNDCVKVDKKHVQYLKYHRSRFI